MTSSSVVPLTAASIDDRSLTASDYEEYEYEEIEIEEEIEVEEEVTDDDHDDENGKTTIICNDDKFPQCDGGIMTAETSIPINKCSKQVTASDKVPNSGEQTAQVNTKDVRDAQQNESGCILLSGKACRRDQCIVLAGKSTIMSNDEKSSQCDGGIVTAETTNPINECSKQVSAFDNVPHSEEVSTLVNTKDVGDAQQKESRLDVDVSLIRPRSSSPAMEISKGNKRPARICNFFAKGWCIKGSSCKFLHIKDITNVADIQNKTQKSDEGVSKGTRSELAISAATIVTCSSEIKPTSQKEIPATNSSLNDVDKDNPPVKADSSLHGPLSNPFMGFPNTHRSNWVSSYATKMEDFDGKGNHFGLRNCDYNTKYDSSVWPKTSTLLSSSSWKSDSQIFSYDWEPSKPFRSAFLISQGISTPDIQFDPVRNSIEPPPKNAHKLAKLSSSSRVPSISGTHSSFSDKLKTEYGSDRFSIGSHVNGNNGMDVDINEVADTKQETTKSASKGKEDIGDVVQPSEVHVSSHYSLGQNDGGPTKELNNHKLDFDAEGDMHRESKPLRLFRAALIEFVKELVKPTWHDGKLSKDAHKLIVKKAVDKVLATLPPEQIPNTKESIGIYCKVWKNMTTFPVSGQLSSLSNAVSKIIAEHMNLPCLKHLSSSLPAPALIRCTLSCLYGVYSL